MDGDPSLLNCYMFQLESVRVRYRFGCGNSTTHVGRLTARLTQSSDFRVGMSGVPISQVNGIDTPFANGCRPEIQIYRHSLDQIILVTWHCTQILATGLARSILYFA